jgi:hypothetical protein
VIWKLGIFLLFVFPPLLELLLGAFVKQLCSMTVGFMMSVCLPVCLSLLREELGSHWMVCNKILYSGFLVKSVHKILIWLK